MSKLTKDNFKYVDKKTGVQKNLTLVMINKYITMINESLNTSIAMSPSWSAARANLMHYLNDNDFAKHEGLKINTNSINKFIERMRNPEITFENNPENNNDNLNFLPLNKVSEMAEPDFSLGYNQEYGNVNVPITAQGNARGRVGMDDLFQFVASKNHQDIVRRNNFMPGQFQIWNANPKGGNNKYYGADEDIDHDGVPEFVVRRGDANGPKVAVNGYTTKLSDWVVRKPFYEKYPSRKDRKGKNIKNYVNEEYFQPVYAANQMDITGYNGINPKDLHYEGRYNIHLSTERSPYRALCALLVNPVVKQALLAESGNNAEDAKQLRKQVQAALGGTILETYVASSVYDEMIRKPLLQKLQQTGDYDRLKANYVANKLAKNREYNANALNDPKTKEYDDFIKSILNRAAVKKSIKSYTATIITEHLDELKASLLTQVRALIDQFIQE